MKKGILAVLFVLFAFLLPIIASAGITESGLKDYYNLGDSIRASYTLLQENDVSGIFKVGIFCPGYDIDYFVTPVALKASQTKTIETYELAPASNMLGNCGLRAQLQSFDKKNVEEHISDNFTVTELLISELAADKGSFQPGEKVKVSGTISASYGRVNGTASIKFDDTSFSTKVSNGALNYTISLPENVKSGNHSIRVKVNDSFSNYVEDSLYANVFAVPTYLRIAASPESVYPEETTEIRAILYDQANDSMNGDVAIELLALDGKRLLSRNLSSGSSAEFTFPQFSPPGSYTIKASSSKINSRTTAVVKKLELIDISFDNRTAYVRNIGNVEYSKAIEILLTKGDEEISIVKKVSIKPNQTLKIDIYKEVPGGNYNITMPVTVENGTANEVTFSNIKTVDERSVLKKTADGFGAITGMLIGSGKGKKKGVLLQTPVLASLIVLASIGGVAFLYSRRSKKAKPAKEKASETKEEGPLFPEKEEAPVKKAHEKQGLGKEEADRFVYDTLKEKKFR